MAESRPYKKERQERSLQEPITSSPGSAFHAHIFLHPVHLFWEKAQNAIISRSTLNQLLSIFPFSSGLFLEVHYKLSDELPLFRTQMGIGGHGPSPCHSFFDRPGDLIHSGSLLIGSQIAEIPRGRFERFGDPPIPSPFLPVANGTAVALEEFFSFGNVRFPLTLFL